MRAAGWYGDNPVAWASALPRPDRNMFPTGLAPGGRMTSGGYGASAAAFIFSIAAWKRALRPS